MDDYRFVDRFEELHGPYLLGELSAEEERELKRHLEGCSPCRGRLESARRVHALLRAAALAPSPESKALVLKRATDGTPRHPGGG